MLFDKALRAGSLSQSDLAVVDYVTRHPQEVLHMSSRALGEAAFVSPSTVVRLCKKAGFASFGDMKVALARELSDEEAFENLDADFPQLENSSAAQVVTRMSSLRRQAIRKTERLLSSVGWRPMLDALGACGGLTVYAMGYSMDASREFVHNMRRLGVRVTRMAELSDALEWAAICPRDELSVLVSYTGMTNLCLDVAHIIYRRGLRSIAVCAEGDSPLQKACTWHMPVALTQRRFANDRIGNFQACAAQEYALSVLYSLHFANDYAHNVQRISDMMGRQGIDVVQDGEGSSKLVATGGDAPSWFGDAARYVQGNA